MSGMPRIFFEVRFSWKRERSRSLGAGEAFPDRLGTQRRDRAGARGWPPPPVATAAGPAAARRPRDARRRRAEPSQRRREQASPASRPAARRRRWRAATNPSARRAWCAWNCRCRSACTAHRDCSGPAGCLRRASASVSTTRSMVTRGRRQPLQLGIEEADVEGRVVDDERRIAEEVQKLVGDVAQRAACPSGTRSDSPCTARASGCTSRSGLM